MLVRRSEAGTYYVDFVYKGGRYQKTTGTPNLRKAREFEANMREKLRLGTYGLESQELAPRLGDFVNTFLKSITTRGVLKPGTISFYQTKCSALLSFEPLRTLRIDQINEDHIERYTQWRLKAVSPGTVDLELATLRVLFSSAYKWKKLNRIPVVEKLNRSTPRDFVLSTEQERAYLSTCPTPLAHIALLLLQTGLRLGEALRLEWEDLDWTNLPDGVGCWLSVKEGKSQNAKRCLPVPLEAAEMLKARRRVLGPMATLVFPSRTGTAYRVTSLDHVHGRVRAKLIEAEETKDAGFTSDFVLHSLRHTYLSRLGESGADGFAIMKLAGHGQITTSQRYIHPTSEHLARTVAKMVKSRTLETVAPEWTDSQVLPANFTALSAPLSVSC